MTFRYAHWANYSFYHQMSSKLTKHNRIKKIGHQIHRKHYITPNNLSLDLADWWNRNNHKKDTLSRGVTTFFAKSVFWIIEFHPGDHCNVYFSVRYVYVESLKLNWGWAGLWGFSWWAPSTKRKNHHRVSSGWSSTWFHSNIGLSSTQYEQIPIIFGVWPLWLTHFFFGQ